MTETTDLTPDATLLDLVGTETAPELPDVPDDLKFTSAGVRDRDAGAVVLELDGARYTFRMPKTALLTDIARMMSGKIDEKRAAVLFPLIRDNVLTGDDLIRITDRMDDPSDSFDWPDLMRIVGYLLPRWQPEMTASWRQAALPAPK